MFIDETLDQDQLDKVLRRSTEIAELLTDVLYAELAKDNDGPLSGKISTLVGGFAIARVTALYATASAGTQEGRQRFRDFMSSFTTSQNAMFDEVLGGKEIAS